MWMDFDFEIISAFKWCFYFCSWHAYSSYKLCVRWVTSILKVRTSGIVSEVRACYSCDTDIWGGHTNITTLKRWLLKSATAFSTITLPKCDVVNIGQSWACSFFKLHILHQKFFWLQLHFEKYSLFFSVLNSKRMIRWNL